MLRMASRSFFFLVVLVLLQCALFTWSQTVPSPETCQSYIDSQNCDFYRECVEARVTCGTGGYALGYGDRYCRRFAIFSGSFSADGQRWIEGVRKCLMEEVQSSQVYITAETSPASCDQLRNVAFDSHPKCYVDHGFCSFFGIDEVTNLYGLYSVFEFRDLWSAEAWRQVGETISRCTQIGVQNALSAIEELSRRLLQSARSAIEELSRRIIGYGLRELFLTFYNPCHQVSNEAAAVLSVVFLLDSSGSIGASAFTTMKSFATGAAVSLAMNGARVGVVTFSDSASEVVTLKLWDDIAELSIEIEGIPYSGGSTNTHIGIETASSVLGSEGTRVLLLFTDGMSNDEEAAEGAANAAKDSGINLYAGGIGGSVNEEELNNLASFPPEDYRVSIANFSASAFNLELQPLIASTCLTPQRSSSGQQLEGVLGEGNIRSLQYDLPAEGLTLMADVPNGEANLYGSYTIRNPTFFTSDFMTGGSGHLTYYIPPPEGSKKRQTDGAPNTVFISLIGKTSNTTFTMNTTNGNMTIRREPGAPVELKIVNLTPNEANLTWSRPLLTNGVVTEYMVLCDPEIDEFPDRMKTIEVSFVESDRQQFTAHLNGFRSGVTYICTVRASNDAGYGPANTVILTSNGTKGNTTPGLWMMFLLAAVTGLAFSH